MIPGPCLCKVHFHFKKNVCNVGTGNKIKKLTRWTGDRNTSRRKGLLVFFNCMKRNIEEMTTYRKIHFINFNLTLQQEEYNNQSN